MIDIEKLANEHYQAIFRFCSLRVGADRAADVAQETFLTAHRAAKNFRGESKPLTWLYGIAHNECRRSARKSSDANVPITFLESQPSNQDPSAEVINRQALREAMTHLSDEQRDVVLMHEIEGLSYDEIAVVLSVPVGTVKSRLHYAFQVLRRQLFPSEVMA